MKFYLIEIDETRDDRLRKSFKDLEDRLRARLPLQKVASVEQCDFVLAVVPVTSRAGTDLKNAVRKISGSFSHPVHKPVVLSVFHHTFEDQVVPRSRNIVFEENFFPVDFLYYEDVGLLRCLSNDKALKAVTDHLLYLKNPPSITKYEPSRTHTSSGSDPLDPPPQTPESRIKPSVCDRVVLYAMTVIIIILIVFSVVLLYNHFFNR